MKKIAALIAMTVVASAANAAPVAATGTINTWKSFNAAAKQPIPYFVAKAGFDLVQSTVAGDNLTSAPFYAAMSINVAGTIDNVTGFGTLTQVGSFTGYYDVNSDNITDDDTGSTTATVTDAGSMTISGLAWTLDATGMHQTAGSASGCTSASPVCGFTVSGVNVNDHLGGTGNSVFDFQGINAGFQTLPKSNGAGTSYGNNAKTWAATGGLNSIVITALTSMTAGLANQIDSGSVTTNAANVANLNLTLEAAPAVPVPAAAWLMGSSLVGLAGIARRRKMA